MNMPMKSAPQPERKLGEFTAPTTKKIEVAAREDSYLGAELARLQTEGFMLLNGIIEDIQGVLSNVEASVTPENRNEAMTAAQMRSHARERENQARERRELARDLVLGALAGMECEEMSDDLDRQRFLLALLQADL
jgi:hypothetical protein